MTTRPDIKTGKPFPKRGFENINETQEDIDLLIAFESDHEGGAVTHLVLIEAKAYVHWINGQLKSRAKRLRDIFL